jgi:hypothetical protein
MTLINILTRTGNRESYYKTLKNSIDTQTYDYIRHIKSNDNPSCEFLRHEKDVFEVERDKAQGEAFYNTYLNTLGTKVKEGWIIILDDDSKLIDPNFIKSLAKECSKSSENEVLIFRSYIWPTKKAFPPEQEWTSKLIKRRKIDMSCFCAHSTVLNKFKFDGRICGDFNFLFKLIKNDMFKFKFVDITPIGIWANYDGSKQGKSVS